MSKLTSLPQKVENMLNKHKRVSQNAPETVVKECVERRKVKHIFDDF